MRYKLANTFFILGFIFYVIAGIFALNDIKFNLFIASIGVALFVAGLYEIIREKISQKTQKTASKD